MSGVGRVADLCAGAAAASSVVRCPCLGRRGCLFSVVLLTAIGSLTTSLLVDRAAEVQWPGLAFWIAVAVVAATQFMRIKVRVGGDYLLVGWGEVATITALCLVAPVWLPLAWALGALVAHIDRLLGVPAGQRRRVPYAIVALTVAATAAAAVPSLLNGGATRPLQLHADVLATVCVLLAAAVAHFGVSSLLAAAWVTDGRGIGTAWRSAARAKRFMLPGNIAVGTAVAVVMAIEPRWLVALVPIVAMLHRAHIYQARVDEGQDQWENLVYATRELNHPEAPAVAAAALRGAMRLFGAAEVEVALNREPTGATAGSSIWYGSGDTDNAELAPGQASPMRGAHIVARPLVAGDASLGEMRLGFDRSRELSPATELVFAAYAYAVANALSEAATHHRLNVMAARSAFDAAHDPLTGLANRSMLVVRGDAELSRRRPGAPAAVLLLDVDTFRAVNDALGPAAGDELLRMIAERLAAAVRDGEILARLGGDEFALLLTGETASPPAAVVRAKEIAALVATPVEVVGVTIAITSTVGVGLGQLGGADPGRLDTTELVRRAGLALRRARREDLSVAQYANVPDPGMDMGDRHAVLADLRDALATTDQLDVVLQPVVSMSTNAPLGAEVLVRWRHPTRGVLLPADFLGAVELSELAGGFTRHVIGLALGIAATWSAQGVDLPVTVNLCARCSLDPQLPPMVADRLAAHGVPPGRLIVEITEGIMVADPDRVECSVAALRELGVQVSVGDFGTASASLELLARCRVDEVKIDRTFVAAITTSPETRAIVAATVDIARDLDMRVVAEAVELPEQRDALYALGVTMAQGHLFYPPLSAAEATALVTRWRPSAD